MIRSSAPTRIDLAGGTIDIWPICHVLDEPAVTVNVAIDLRAEAEVEETADGHVEVISEDRGERLRLPATELSHDTWLGLATRLVEWYGPGNGLRVRLRAQAPPGSGLGGSSALAIALAGALATLRNDDVSIGTVQALETKVLGVPTGYQDYYPPRFGGLNALTGSPLGVQIDEIDALDFVADHLMLADTKIEHHSGMNNWEIVKRFFDGDEAVRRGLNAINACATELRTAVAARDLAGFAAALGREWAERRQLAPVVSNERIEAIDTAARKAGALATKVCGAGGGGCMVLVVADREDAAVRAAVESAGGALVEFAPDENGLTVG